MTDLIASAWEGETSLLTAQTRTDAVHLDRLLAADFREIGQSGRPWTRADIIAALLESDDEVLGATLSDCDGRVIGPDTVLLTYRLESRGRTSRRSSLWRRERGTMRCFFHQGTPVPARTPPAAPA
ncbi:DUF4440 domain-containing protein [Microbacterium caowuchunii]|uniref:nuclear transport factor 2 family protein n=1 Tax=Microbacterium caowuchunii TaxID=2614638 RepID=UPI001780E480|nr:DUF4440 domain-containing protein [Microbacterium caowuchunii]